MGDIVTFVEKAQQQFSEEKAVELEEKFRKSQFTFEDFLDQLREIKKNGTAQSGDGHHTGMNRLPANAAVDEKGLVRIQAIIQSMTKGERLRPSILNGNRRRRIASGSETAVQDVNRLLKQFEEMQRMMKRFGKGNVRRSIRGMQFPA